MIAPLINQATRCTIIALLLLLGAGGCGTPSFLITPVSSSNRLEETVVQSGQKFFGNDKIAIIELEGMLANARAGGLLQATENPVSKFVQQLNQAERDTRVKAVVLRVNSPGGTVTASDNLYEQVIRFKQRSHKPVVACALEVSASGAYYVSCAADRIVASPTSVVGSIGVILNTFDASGAMAKIGLKNEAIKSGAYKDIGSPFRPIKDDERQLMQALVDEYYARFSSIVTTNRHLSSPDVIHRATDGRVFSGMQALAMGLIDQTGTLEDAIDLARKLSNAPTASAIMYRRPYAYGGSIYASTEVPNPQANVLHLDVPIVSRELLPTGFYYLWDR